jgi:hypothetical protein
MVDLIRNSNARVFSSLRAEIYVLWGISVLVSLIVLGASFYLTPEAVDGGVLSLLSVPHEHCPLCGMSHSLVLISRGSLTEAAAWNSGGPALYLIMVTNIALSFLWVIRRSIRRVREGEISWV